MGLPYPTEYGGQGGDYLSYILAVEEVSKVDGAMGISYSVSTSLYGGALTNSQATDEQLKKFLTPVASGKSTGSFALTEPGAGSDAGSLMTKAKEDGDFNYYEEDEYEEYSDDPEYIRDEDVAEDTEDAPADEENAAEAAEDDRPEDEKETVEDIAAETPEE